MSSYTSFFLILLITQANLENLRELRHGMIETETSDIANFTLAFTAAFEILAKVFFFFNAIQK